MGEGRLEEDLAAALRMAIDCHLQIGMTIEDQGITMTAEVEADLEVLLRIRHFEEDDLEVDRHRHPLEDRGRTMASSPSDPTKKNVIGSRSVGGSDWPESQSLISYPLPSS